MSTKLDDAQKQMVAKWIAEGSKLSEIQNKMATELGLGLTYMEVRFLIDDLKLKLQEREPPAPIHQLGAHGSANETIPSANAGSDQPAATPPVPGGEEFPAGASGVSVKVDTLTRPGALVSGSVTFSDGNSAQWYLDQEGRLGLVAKQAGYRPPQSDLVAFQTELQKELAKLGF